MTHQQGNLDVDRLRSKVVEDTRATISKHGWSVIGVFPVPGEPGVDFSYTVGLSGLGLPELAMYGLPASTAGHVLNKAARAMVERGTALQQGDWVDLDGAPARAEARAHDDLLVAIEMQDTSNLNMVRTIFNEVKSAVQLVWPTRNGLMPWELDSPECEEQPVLGTAVTTTELYRARPLRDVDTFAKLDQALSASELVADTDDPKARNEKLAHNAGAGFVQYARRAGIYNENSEELATHLGDFLSDIRHLVDLLDADWDEMITDADRHYRAEIHGDI